MKFASNPRFDGAHCAHRATHFAGHSFGWGTDPVAAKLTWTSPAAMKGAAGSAVRAWYCSQFRFFSKQVQKTYQL